jgi:hypothetical protein
MQSQVEVRPIFASSKYTAEKEQDALEVLTMAVLLKKYIAAGKDKTKQEFFKLRWTNTSETAAPARLHQEIFQSQSIR